MSWIPLEDRLPELDATVLVYSPCDKNQYGDVPIVEKMRFNSHEPNYKGGFWISLGMGQMVRITHWCPIPAPPVATPRGGE